MGEGRRALLWCSIMAGNAELMLQQNRTEGHDACQFSDNREEGVEFCFFCEDAVSLYRDWNEKGLGVSEPRVGNGTWGTHIKDPDGYKLAFESDTDVVEGTRLSEND